MSEQGEAVSVPRLVVHLLHGTWAENAPWTQDGSPFRSHLVERLRAHGVDGEIDFAPLSWGGANRQSARVAGAEKLAAALRAATGPSQGVRHLLIGHSHGGSVAVLACRDAAAASKVAGVACLATPFLVFRAAPYLNQLHVACVVAWWVVVLFAMLPWLDSWPAVPISLPIPIAFAGYLYWYWTLRNGYREPAAVSVPESLPMPVFLIRCPGDEASGALGASLIAERMLVVLSHRTARVWGWLRRHWLLFPLIAVAIGVVVAAAMFASLKLTGSLAALAWPAIVVAALLFVLLVLPLLLAFPLRVLLYWRSYGPDVAMRGAFLLVSAEPTPPGVWTLHSVLPRDNKDELPGLAHSEPYGNTEAIDQLARWASGLLRPA